MNTVPNAGDERISRWAGATLAALAVALLLWNGYRASTLSITHDEAFTHLWYVAKGPRGIYSPTGYIANNHFLYSLLAWISVQGFGLSEWALRLPSVLAGAMLVPLAGRWFHRSTGSVVLTLTGVLVLVLNPLVMDFCTAARGYSLALALSLWGWWHLGQALQADSKPLHLRLAGVGMGLAIAANLTYLFPHVAFGAMFVLLKLLREPTGFRAALVRIGLHLVLPATAIIAGFCYPAFHHLQGDRFYYGSDSLCEMAQSLIEPALQAAPERAWLAGDASTLTMLLMGLVVVVLLPLPFALYRVVKQQDGSWMHYALIAGAMVGLIGLHVLSHHFKGTPYPKDRTALYFLPLVLACTLQMTRLTRWLRYAVLAVAALIIAHFVTQLQVDYLYPWRYDAGTRRIYDRLSTLAADRDEPLRVEHTWLFEPSTDFYRAMDRKSTWQSFLPGKTDIVDYYILEAADVRATLLARQLHVVHEDPISHVVIAAPLSMRVR